MKKDHLVPENGVVVCSSQLGRSNPFKAKQGTSDGVPSATIYSVFFEGSIMSEGVKQMDDECCAVARHDHLG